MIKIKDNNGFSAIELLIVLVIVVLLGMSGWLVYKANNRNSAGPYVYVTNSSDDNVSVINSSNKVVKTINVENHPAGIAISPISGEVYVANTDSNTVSIINPSKNYSVSSINVGKDPAYVAVSPKTGNVYVASDSNNTVSIINPSKNYSVSSINVGKDPRAIAVSPFSGYIYIVDGGSGGVLPYVSVINPANNNLIATVNIPSYYNPISGYSKAGDPQNIAISPISGKVYILTNTENVIYVINPSTYVVTSDYGNYPAYVDFSHIAFSRSGEIYAATPLNTTSLGVVINPSNMKISSQIGKGHGGGWDIAVSQSNGNIYVLSLFGGVDVVNPKTLAVVAHINVGLNPHSIAISN